MSEEKRNSPKFEDDIPEIVYCLGCMISEEELYQQEIEVGKKLECPHFEDGCHRWSDDVLDRGEA